MKAVQIVVCLAVAFVVTACGGGSNINDWELRAVAIDRKPIGNGWALLSAQLAFVNSSDHWQAIDVSSGRIICKEGCYYSLMSLADTSDDSRSQEYDRGKQNGANGFIDVSTGRILIPPGFQVVGRINEDNKSVLLNTLEVEVGESTSGHSGYVDEFWRWDLSPDPVGDRIASRQTIDLSDPSPVTSPIFMRKKELQIHGVGEPVQLHSSVESVFTVDAADRNNDSLVIGYSLQNISKTTAATYGLGLYLIGNDGLIRTCETTSPGYSFDCRIDPVELSPGPNQKSVGTRVFDIPPEISDLYLVVILRGYYTGLRDAFVFKL